jgi:hypothetical protein
MASTPLGKVWLAVSFFYGLFLGLNPALTSGEKLDQLTNGEAFGAAFAAVFFLGLAVIFLGNIFLGTLYAFTGALLGGGIISAIALLVRGYPLFAFFAILVVPFLSGMISLQSNRYSQRVSEILISTLGGRPPQRGIN